jgi:RNA polymerase sigma-70 factor (ECF subfamily)
MFRPQKGPMSQEPRLSSSDNNDSGLPGLERYRSYLMLLARVQVNPHLRDPVDVSGIVQQTFLEAHQNIASFRGRSSEQLAAWLRQILARNLADALRGMGAAKRDVARQCSIDDALANSSARLAGWLVADQSSPSQYAQRVERAVELADALAALPDAQREALVMQYWQECSVAEIAAHLGRTPAAVAGLLKRALKQLKVLLHHSGADVEGRRSFGKTQS